MIRQTADFAVYVLVRLVVAVVQALPLSACERGAEWLANFCTKVLKLRRDVVEENLQTAFPNLSPRSAKRSPGRCGDTCS